MESIHPWVVNCNSYAKVFFFSAYRYSASPKSFRTVRCRWDSVIIPWFISQFFCQIPGNDSMSPLKISVSSWIFMLPKFAPRWRIGDCFPIHMSQLRLCALLLSILPNLAARGMASPVRLLHSPSSSGAPAFRNFGLPGSECEFFSNYTFLHGNSGDNGSPRASSSSCDWVCDRSPRACTRILSLRIVAGQNNF